MIEELFKKELYLKEIDRLKKKIQNGKYKVSDYGVTESITLAWMLYNQEFVINEIIRTLKNKEYKSPTAIEKKVRIEDKERLLYSFDWHERILQGAVANLLYTIFEPHFSESLQSYRKGRGSHNTLLMLSNYLGTASENKELFIIKKDIKAYGDNISHEKLFKIFSKHIPENDYLLEVIKKIIQFNYYDHQNYELKTKTIGMPTGSPVNNVVANIFLVELDKKIDKYKDKSCYFRYGDDILLATHNKETAECISKILSKFILESELKFNEEKIADMVFNVTSKKDERFKYLGLMVTPTGKMRLTIEKDKDIKLNIKNMISKMDKMFSKITNNKQEKADNIVICIKILLFKTPLYPWLLSYFPVVNDEDYWKELDLWIAKTMLARIYNKAGDRVFGNYPFKKLRDQGLPSLLHLRRLYLDDRKRFLKCLTK